MPAEAVRNPVKELLNSLGARHFLTCSDIVTASSYQFRPRTALIVDLDTVLRLIDKKIIILARRRVVGTECGGDAAERRTTILDQVSQDFLNTSPPFSVPVCPENSIDESAAVPEDVALDRRSTTSFHRVVVDKLSHKRVEVRGEPPRLYAPTGYLHD
jgi:hypothetical protein